MKMKHLIIISLILAILTMSAVSASDNLTQNEYESSCVTTDDEPVSEINEDIVSANQSPGMTTADDEPVSEINEDIVSEDESQDSHSSDNSYESISIEESDDIPKEISFVPPSDVAKGNPTHFVVTSFDGNMIVKIDGIKKEAVFVERADEVSSVYDVSTQGFDIGKHVLSIDINSNRYGHVTKNFTFEIKEIIVDAPMNITIGGYSLLYIQVPTAKDINNVSIYVDDEKIILETYNNWINYKFEDLTAPTEGYIHKLTVEYGDIYNETFNLPTYYTFDLIDETCWHDKFASEYSFIAPENFLKDNFVAKINGKTYPIKQESSLLYSVDVSSLDVGQYTIYISYYDKGNFYKHTEKATINMIPTINVDYEVYNGKGSIEVIAPGKPLTVYVHVYNKNDDYRFSAKTVNGKATFSLAKLNAGTYAANVEYEGIVLDGYTTYYITVKNSKLTAKNLSKFYRSSTVFKVKVNDYKGKIVKSKYVKFYINGKYVKKVKTNKKGYATLKIAKAPGKYNVTAKYGKVVITRTLTVKHVVNLKTANVNKSAKSIILKATLKQGKKALKNKKVTFKFNGKTFKAKTNKYGVAKVKIKRSILKKLNVGKTVKYQATYLKDTVKKSAKVKK